MCKGRHKLVCDDLLHMSTYDDKEERTEGRGQSHTSE